MDYRVENKYLVSDADIAVISHRLSGLMDYDRNQHGKSYEIRSLYFDDINDSCMDENDSGVDARRKYRIRSYGPAFDFLRLEIKEKLNGYTRKRSCALTESEFEAIVCRASGLIFGEKAPLNELLLRMRCSLMQPKAIIRYERSAFVYPSGNVRVTFDRNICASRACDEFSSLIPNGYIPLLPKGLHILEVKYDELLPDAIAQQLEIGKLQKTAFSKYYLGRLALNNEFLY